MASGDRYFAREEDGVVVGFFFVEHETANGPGAAFWSRRFDPFVAYAMRYVDPATGR